MSTIELPRTKFESLWHAVLRARALDRANDRFPVAVRAQASADPVLTDTDDPHALLSAQAPGAWSLNGSDLDAPTRRLLELYLPLLGASPGRGWCVAHLGQSLDGHIATREGLSRYVTGVENLDHMHRMRALADVVVVGAETVRSDDPRLTTRRVAGPSPVRAVIDPRRTVAPSTKLLCDGAAPTLLLCDQKHREGESLGSGAEVVAVPACDGWFAPADILKALCARGLHAVFVEGGGKTVSAFLRQGALDRLQVTVAPLLIGGGRPGVTLAPIRELADAVRGHSRRFEMGTDVLFDLDLRHAREG